MSMAHHLSRLTCIMRNVCVCVCVVLEQSGWCLIRSVISYEELCPATIDTNVCHKHTNKQLDNKNHMTHIQTGRYIYE